jgi:hypothetical protein
VPQRSTTCASTPTCSHLLFATDDAGVVIRALIDAGTYNAKYAVSSNGPDWQVELYGFTYDPTANDPWPPEIDNLIPVDGLQNGTPASTPALQATWHALHVALTCAMADTDTTPAGWPAAPPCKIPG